MSTQNYLFQHFDIVFPGLTPVNATSVPVGGSGYQKKGETNRGPDILVGMSGRLRLG